MKQKIKYTLFMIWAWAIISCSYKNDSRLNILKDGILERENALSFLQKISKLQFHVNHDQKLVQDYNTLSKRFLLKNIDLSYTKSRQFIKKGLISEYSFANYILPYKINQSIAHDWRDESLSLYTIPDKKLHQCLNSDSMLNLCNIIDKYTKTLIKYNADGIDENFLTLDEIVKRGSGSCYSFCNLNSYLSRANGLPVTSDYVPSWGNMDGNHCWNVLVPNEHEFYSIYWSDLKNKKYDPLILLNSDKEGINSYRVPPKVYRKGIIPDTSSVYLKYFKELSNMGISFTDLDVTSSYVKTINFNTKLLFESPSNILLLNVLNSGGWSPVSAISTYSKNYEFTNIGVENLYLISSLDYETNSFLFYVDKLGKVYNLDKKLKHRISIQRDRSVVQQQLDYISKNGWNIPDSIKNLSIKPVANLSNQIQYSLYSLISGKWKILERKSTKNRQFTSSGYYYDGLYVILPEHSTITRKTRPFLFVNGQAIFI